MIVTSKRCFLNKFIQRNSAETILNANYYLADANPKNTTSMEPDRRRNAYGEIEEASFTYSSSGITGFGSTYYISFVKPLDPTPHNTSHKMGKDSSGVYRSPEELFINHLQNSDTALSVFNIVFGKQLQGNGLQILMYDSDKNIKRFGHIVCQFLSMTYGVDIIFLDPAFRPDCRGQVQYFGDKEQGLRMSRMLKDQQTLNDFADALAQTEATHSVTNLDTFLNNAIEDAEGMMYLYNLLFPNAPLPSGNYTKEQLQGIIVQYATDGMITNGKRFENVLINTDWRSYVENRSAVEDIDFGADDGLF